MLYYTQYTIRHEKNNGFDASFFTAALDKRRVRNYHKRAAMRQEYTQEQVR